MLYILLVKYISNIAIIVILVIMKFILGELLNIVFGIYHLINKIRKQIV